MELAKAGDVTALRMCLDRLIPPYRAKDATIAIGELKGTLTEQGQQVITAMARGDLAPGDTANMLQALASQARLVETDELEKRVKALEERRHGT